ncbi:DUF885 domain-containing protein [Tamlana agarivorans]|uniref:DUF885 domain-containing protein n=1 Tax=Pseudotamlana agarivorans TaxID=481183 RepID=A0ACC5U6S1_9FLAO|nr:DUF885 domain-containing protein [Tamlana agarivorans]MBU2950017.1 DUF885 domain-containing protein [Tamlana agarivorans]
MKRLLPLLMMLIFSVTACKEKTSKEVYSDQNESFESFKDEFLLELWKQNPSWASWAGLHEYDSILNTFSLENRQKLLTSNKEIASKLQTFELTKLDDGNKIDYHLIDNFIESEVWYLNEFKSYEWNASNYNIADRVWTIMNGNYADLDTRLDILSTLLVKVPSFYQSGIDNLKNPTMEHLELGLIQNKGALEVLDDGLLDSISNSSLSDKRKDLLKLRVNESKDAITNYISTLEKLKLEFDSSSASSPRIGKALFTKKYELEVNSNYTAEEIYNKALKEKEALHQQMIVISDTLWNNYLVDIEKPTDKIAMVKMLIDKIAEKHVSRENFFEEINRQIPILSAFVKDHDLLTQDPSKPLVVRETPPYMRGGGAGASVSSPGPYEKGKNTYYNVTPLDDYSDEEAESYLREYNHYILQILNIHEAIPGHYTQLVYGNESPSIIKSILQNGAMIEGWANYAEIMMLEEGYNNSPEMWLMRNKWHLRGVTNTILDYSYHVLNLEKEEAMKLMIKDAFQEKTEAENKWRRVTLSSVQLSSYFTGFSQIYELRDEIKGIKGDSFNLKEFHEQFLSYGNAPVKHIRELMLK